ncbi:MAG: hypothetical protein M3513_03325 [Actinomycetota bacterium]|nr:hypothetical protein [Actinomycetota bacterium]
MSLTLPEKITAAVAAFERAGVALHEHVAVDLQAARDGYAADVAEALRRDTPLPAADAVEQVAVRARQHQERQLALVAAEQLLFDELRATLPGPDQLVTEHLRPALTDVYGQARTLLDRHGPVLGGPAELAITGPTATAKAWSEFGALVSRVSALRTLHYRVTDPAVSKDTSADFATWRESWQDERLWGAKGGRQGKWRPWPEDPRAHLAWLLQSGLTIWVPTATERDARHTEAHPNRLRMAADVMVVV